MSLSLNSTQAYLQVLAFPFQDRAAWKKIAIGGLLSLSAPFIPVLPILFLYGYGARIMKRILHQDGDPYLPEWENWDTLLTDGLRLWGASILVGLPVVILTLASLGMVVLPWVILPFTLLENGSPSNEALLTVFVCLLLGLFGFVLAFLISLPTIPLQAAIVSHVAARNSFQAMFRVAEWWPILRVGWRIFLTEAAVVLLLSWIGSLLISFVGATIVLLCLYPFLLALYTFLLTLYSQTLAALAYRQGNRLLASSLNS